MALNFVLWYHKEVVDSDIPQLSPAVRARIRRAIEVRLTTHPEQFGRPLRRSLRGYRKLRIGDYRVIFRIEGATVKILLIAHRSIVYHMSDRRILNR